MKMQMPAKLEEALSSVNGVKKLNKVLKSLAIAWVCLLVVTPQLSARFLWFGEKKTEAEIKRQHLRGDLQSKDPVKKLKAISEAGKSKDKKMVADLTKIIKNDKSIPARQEACESLGKIGDNFAVSSLVSALNSDETISVKIEAASALYEIKSDEAEGALKDALKKEKNKGVKLSLMKFLAAYKDKDTIGIFRKLSKDKDEDIRASAIYILGEFGERDIVLKALKDRDEKVKEKAVDALGRMGETGELEKIKDKNLKKRAEIFLKRKK